jgi:endonuclease-3
MPRKANPKPTTKPAKRMRNKPASRVKISPAKAAGKPSAKSSAKPAKTVAGDAATRSPGKAASKSPAKSAGPLARVARSRPAKPVISPRAGAKPWTAADTEEAFRRFREANPHPRGELEHVDPYTLLVAVVLSAQATDAGVNKATRALFAVADTPHKMVALGEEKLRDYIRTVGLFRTKAKNVIALSQKLLAEHGGVVPPSREALETLPGVGRKTANVVLNVAFGAETIAVDTHIFRVGNRTGLAPGANPLEVEMKLEERVPPAYRRHAHHWLILHGRYTCKAQRPMCGACLINDLCHWPDKAQFMTPAASGAPIAR